MCPYLLFWFSSLPKCLSLSEETSQTTANKRDDATEKLIIFQLHFAVLLRPWMYISAYDLPNFIFLEDAYKPTQNQAHTKPLSLARRRNIIICKSLLEFVRLNKNKIVSKWKIFDLFYAFFEL